MSTEYQGDPDNVTTPLTRTVIGATNATPIVVQTGVNHDYQTGDYVEISGVGGNLAANGAWRIAVVDADHFSLNTSVGSGVYTAGGTVKDQSLTPVMTQPADGDLRSAASVNLAIDLLADRTQFLARRSRVQVDVITTSGTWKCPPDVTSVTVEGWGGGGGGGGGDTGASGVAGAAAPGGGGGGTSACAIHTLTVVPGTVYATTIGAGGAGGAVTANGLDGTPSSFGSLAFFIAGAGGRKGVAVAAAATNNPIAPGGSSAIPGAGQYPVAPSTGLAINHAFRSPPPGHGGHGAWTNAQTTLDAIGLGGAAPGGGYGGYAGSMGAASGVQLGGGGGGGGGGGNGYGANGPIGGNGGNGNNAGVGTAGSVGTAAATANSGGGGGGGGGGGSGSTGAGLGKAGGAGAAGKLIIRYNGTKAVTT